MEFNVDGQKTLFLAYPFEVIPPSVGDDNQDVQVIFSNITSEIIEGITGQRLLTINNMQRKNHHIF